MYLITSLILVCMAVATARAYMPGLIFRLNPAARDLAWSFVLFIAAAVGRSVYWGQVRFVMGDHWADFRDALGGLTVNAAFDAILIFGLYLALRARWQLLPPEVRAETSVLQSITYPTPLTLRTFLNWSAPNDTDR